MIRCFYEVRQIHHYGSRLVASGLGYIEGHGAFWAECESCKAELICIGSNGTRTTVLTNDPNGGTLGYQNYVYCTQKDVKV
jgi:hypothetical protein